MMLFRRLVGEVLRRHRLRQSKTLREVSAAARVSLGYLSEVERGRKEASSELLAAICAALDISLADVLREVSDELAVQERRLASVPVGFASAAGVRPVASRAVAGVPPLSAARPATGRPGAAGPGRAPSRPGRLPATPVAPTTPVAMLSAGCDARIRAVGAAA